MIVMPGFVDTHRHMWQGALRNILPNGLLSDYSRDITGTARSVFRPEDARIGDLVSALGALNAGVTTVLDWSHIGNSPEHTDAAIEGLARVRHPRGLRIRRGRRAGWPVSGGHTPAAHASTSRRTISCSRWRWLRARAPRDWALARDVGAIISLHVNGSLGVPQRRWAPT